MEGWDTSIHDYLFEHTCEIAVIEYNLGNGIYSVI